MVQVPHDSEGCNTYNPSIVTREAIFLQLLYQEM